MRALCLLSFFLSSAMLLSSSVQADIPRTATGKPDLSGFFDVATITPMERPEEFGDKLFITPEEAAELESARAARRAEQNVKSDPNRDAPPLGGSVGGYNEFWLDAGEERFTVDGKFRTSVITMPANGRRPSMTAAGDAAAKFQVDDFVNRPGEAWWLDEGGSGPYDNMEQRPLRERCLLGFGPVAGPPILPTVYNNHKRIVQTEDYLMILAEMVHDARVIRLNSEHKPVHMRNWMGDSVGHWEGDTLVVDTINFNATPGLLSADANLHVIEKFTRIDSDTLMYSFVVDDPSVWSETWGGEYPWPQTQEKVYEYACHEGNYALGNIMRGARLLEREKVALSAAGGED